MKRLMLSILPFLLIAQPAAATVGLPASPNWSDERATFGFNSDCSWAFGFWPTTLTDPTMNWMFVAEGRRITFDMMVGQSSDLTNSCADISDGAIAANKVRFFGGPNVPPSKVFIDVNANGNYAAFTLDDGSFLWQTPRLASRPDPYRFSAYWEDPSGEKIVTEFIVYVGAEPDVSINNGSTFTNTASIAVDVTPIPGTSYIKISNDGSSKSAGKLSSPGLAIPWQLSSNQSRVTKVLYVRFYDSKGKYLGTLSDDIVFDDQAPVIQSASVSQSPTGVLLKMRAKDNRSGVGALVVNLSPTTKGAKFYKYATTTRIQIAAGSKFFVAVRDKANNVSKWRNFQMKM